MKGSKEIFKKLKKGDFAIVATVVLASAVLFASGFTSNEKITAYIYSDGEFFKAVKLYELEKSCEITVDGCRLVFEKDGAFFAFSECEDKLCVNRGKLKKAGDTMACVPERVSVVLKAEKNEADAVVF